MRIAEVVNSLEVGGTEKLVVDLALELQARGHDLTVFCLRGSGVLETGLVAEGIEVIALNKGEGPSLSTLFRLASGFRRRAVDVVHGHNPLVHHYCAIAGRLAGAKVIVNTIHGTSNLSSAIGFKERLYGMSCLLTDSVVAVCPSAHAFFRQVSTIPVVKLTAINNGIRLDRFLRVTRAPRDHIVFGIIGRLVPVKDHTLLIKAFHLARASIGNLRLEILGDGPLRADLEALVHGLGLEDAVTFRGYSSDVAGFMSEIDVSVLCSQSEGLPLGVLESMAAGLPVVGTDVGGMKDLIEGASCGWLVPPGSVEDLAHALCHAGRSPRDELREFGLRARQFVTEHYSLQRMCIEYEGLFVRMLEMG